MMNIFRSNHIIVAMKWDGSISSAVKIYENLKLFGIVNKVKDLQIQIQPETGTPVYWVLEISTVLSPGQWVVIENVQSIKDRYIEIVSDFNIKKGYSLEFGDALEYDLNTYNIKLTPQNNTL